MAIKESSLVNGTSPHVVQTTLNYHFGSKGVPYYPGTAGGYRRKHDQHSVQVTDIAGHEKQFSLDREGFACIQHESKEKEFKNEEGIKDRLYPEIAQILKEATGATSVRPFSHVVRFERYEDMQQDLERRKDDEIVRKRIPARFVHVDHSYFGAEQVLRDNIEDEEERERLTKTRWAIINVWRPIHHPVTRDPLAVCDARTVGESDLVGVNAILPPRPVEATQEGFDKGKEFETWHVKADPAHRWYYKSQMTPDEALLLKIFDSKMDGRAKRAPHTSFQTEEDHGEPRNSVEVRCFVFWEDQSLE